MSEENESGYYKLSDDFDQLRNGYDGMEKATGGLKLLGKTIFNVGKFAFGEVLPSMVESAARGTLQNENADPEKRQKAEEYLNRKRGE